MDEYTVRLITRLDASKTGEDIKKLENQLNKKGIHIKTVLDTAATKKEIERMAADLQSVLSKTKGFEHITADHLLASIRSLQAETQNLQYAFQELSHTIGDSNLKKFFTSLQNGKESANGLTNMITLLGAAIDGALDAKNPGRPVPVYGNQHHCLLFWICPSCPRTMPFKGRNV